MSISDIFMQVGITIGLRR